MLGQKFSLMVHVKFHDSLVAKGILFVSVLLFFFFCFFSDVMDIFTSTDFIKS